MNNKDRFSFGKRIKSFAFNGLISLIKNEHNARIHFVVLICVIGLGLFFRIDSSEWISIVIVIGFVFVSELFNTAIEKLADFVEHKWDKNIGLIKDYCAGAVLISAITSLIVGGFIFIPRVIELMKTYVNY